MYSSCARLAHDLIKRSNTFKYLQPPIHAQREHPLVHGRITNIDRSHILHDEFSERRRDEHDLVESLPSFEPSAAARLAALALEERKLTDRRVEGEIIQVGCGFGGRAGAGASSRSRSDSAVR